MALCAVAGALPGQIASPPPAPPPLLAASLREAEATWRKVRQPAESLTSRELFSAALAWCEAGRYPERLEPLFRTAAAMQDRDPASKGYGNFKWNWSDAGVSDFNAVDFCLQYGSVIWLRHSQTLPEGARTALRELLTHAVEGCRRHKVRDTYTNIALMNAQDLILLGEALGRPEVADEGYARLNLVTKRTLSSGICEYGSPTYYGVDLDCLLLIDAFCARPAGRQQARALLELFWTDLALNWFAPGARLAGPHSRDYDYLHGHGPLEKHLGRNGWLSTTNSGGSLAIALGKWTPPPALLQLNRERFPRLVRQMWGSDPAQSRAHYLLPEVTLGSAAANYNNMDLPLTVDFAGDSTSPRAYFLPDCRDDPYGQVKIPEARGPHRKTLHLRPFWTAAQRSTDALGLALYKAEPMLETASTLKSHFVLPRAVDEFWLGAQRLDLKVPAQRSLPLSCGEVVVLRKGTAALGIKLVWLRGVGTQPGRAELADDANTNGVVRLTVTHYAGPQPVPNPEGAGAAFWVRIGGGLKTEAEFAAWKARFTEAQAAAEVADQRLRLSAPAAEGAVSILTDYPGGQHTVLNPPPSRAVLELNGQDLGPALLQPALQTRP